MVSSKGPLEYKVGRIEVRELFAELVLRSGSTIGMAESGKPTFL